MITLKAWLIFLIFGQVPVAAALRTPCVWPAVGSTVALAWSLVALTWPRNVSTLAGQTWTGYKHCMRFQMRNNRGKWYVYMIQPPLVPPHPPPKGGYVTHMQPCIGITICLYWFMYVCLCVWLSVCWYVSMCVSQQGRHVIVFVSAHKDTTCTHNVPAPPCGWVGGVLPSAAMYRYNYMFLLIYVW